jgi:hypothetical protein
MSALRQLPRLLLQRLMRVFDLEARVGEFIAALVILAWVYQSHGKLPPSLDLMTKVAPLAFWHGFALLVAVLQAASLLAPPGRLLSYTRWARFVATIMAAYWWGMLTLSVALQDPGSVSVATYLGFAGINVYGFCNQLPWRRRWMN